MGWYNIIAAPSDFSGAPQLAGGIGAHELHAVVVVQDTGIKLQWLKEAAPVLDPDDTMLAPHMRQILQQLFAALQACQPLASPGDARACRHVIHLVNSLLHQCH